MVEYEEPLLFSITMAYQLSGQFAISADRIVPSAADLRIIVSRLSSPLKVESSYELGVFEEIEEETSGENTRKKKNFGKKRG